MAMMRLDVLEHGTSQESVLTVTDAKWKRVEVKGWPHDLTQKASGELVLSLPSVSRVTSNPGLSRSGLSFDNPITEGGGLNLEIELGEMVDVFGNDDVLMVASREAGVNRSITIHCVPGEKPPISKSFRLKPAGNTESQRQLTSERSDPNRASVRFRLANHTDKSNKNGTKEISVADGEILLLPKESLLTALDEAVVGVPVKAVAGEPNVGSVIHCDDGVQMWVKEGRGHPVLSVCIQVGLPAGTSIWLSKSSQVVVSASLHKSAFHGWINQMIPVLDERAERIEAALLLANNAHAVGNDIDEFRKLHREHRSALLNNQLEEARTALTGIFTLSESLDTRETLERLRRNPLRGDPAMLADAFKFGALICCYVAGEFRRRSQAYAKDKSFDLSYAKNAEELVEVYYEIFGGGPRDSRIEIALSDQVG